MGSMAHAVSATYFLGIMPSILLTIVLAVVCIIIVKQLLKVVGKMLERSKIDKSLHVFIKSVVKVLLYFLVVLIVADSLGIDVTSLIAVLSVAGLAVSLAVQGSLSNVAGGLVILTTKPFAVGDFIECGANSGVVKEIGLMSTKIMTGDNKKIIIPNSDISGARIVNYSSEGKRRVDLTFEASYDAPIETVKAALAEAVKNTADALTDDVFIRLSAYKDSSIEYTVRVWCENKDYWQVHFDLLEEGKKAFDRYNVELSYPHMNVHMLEK